MGGVRKVITTNIGTAYTLTLNIDMGTAEGLYIMPRTTNGGNIYTGTNLAQVYVTTSGTHTVTFTASTSTTQLLVEKAGTVTQTFYIDNVKVEQSTPTLNSYPIADVVSAQHYYPYHSTMQTWEADGKEYTFGGANGQEKDNEIFKGAYTAEFWEYDSRLGRRWNRDPVVKPWQSDYSCLSGSPIWRMDPNGDDDFFNAYGQYLFSTKTGTKIQVITSDGTHRLSSLNPSIYNTTISNIATYYGTLVGVSGSIGLRTYEGSIAHTTTATNQVFISTSKRTGSIDMKLDDYTFMKTVLFHEKLHQEEKKLYDPNEKYTYYKHYLVYSKQFQDEETFGKVSDKADQRSLVNNAVNYLIKSQKENDGAMIGQDIDNLNFTLSKYDIKVNLDPEDLSKFTITQDGKTYNGIVKDIKDGPTN